MNLRGQPPSKPFSTFEPIPAGEVTEGNDESDWAAWEDSVAFQDSLTEALCAPATPAPHTSAKAADLTTEPQDVFASVHRNSA